ncbi:hypothetical protein Cde04nite_35980 [Cellulomonas denverensis]|nr:hypothetical protein Cde04nite_35980 [Cellulomonas denverensis]
MTGARRPGRLADRDAQVRFVRRPLAALDAERVLLDLGAVLVTTPEQTLLDLARPAAGDAVQALWPRADRDVLAALARRTRAGAVHDRLWRWMG